MIPPLDPVSFGEYMWPDFFWPYDKQVEIIESVRDNGETVVPAGNMLGKDWGAGYIALTATLCPRLYWPDGPDTHEVRVVTTSVRDDHLRVLWGEIGRFIQRCKYKLLVQDGGPLIYNHRDIRKLIPGTKDVCQISYLRGMVTQKGEGMSGHHAAHTLCIIDEASGVDDVIYEHAGEWAQKFLIIGNCHRTRNFFYSAVRGGDIPRE